MINIHNYDDDRFDEKYADDNLVVDYDADRVIPGGWPGVDQRSVPDRFVPHAQIPNEVADDITNLIRQFNPHAFFREPRWINPFFRKRKRRYRKLRRKRR